MPQTIEFEGAVHQFPDDFSENDIRGALSSFKPPANTAPKLDTSPTATNPNMRRRPNAAERIASATPNKDVSLSEIRQRAAEPIIPVSKLAPSKPTTIIGGVAKGAATLAEGLTTPENVAIAGAIAANPTLAVPAAAYFGANMLESLYPTEDALPAAQKRKQQEMGASRPGTAPEQFRKSSVLPPVLRDAIATGDKAKIAEALTTVLGTVALAGAATSHVMKAGEVPVRPPGLPVEAVPTPPVEAPPTVAPTPLEIRKQAVKDRIAQRQVAPVEAPANPESLTRIGEMGQGIVGGMYDMLWGKVEKGDVNEAGKPSAVLQVAKAIRDRGGLQSRDEFEKLATDYANIKQGPNRNADLNSLVDRYSPAAIPPIIPADPLQRPINSAEDLPSAQEMAASHEAVKAKVEATLEQLAQPQPEAPRVETPQPASQVAQPGSAAFSDIAEVVPPQPAPEVGRFPLSHDTYEIPTSAFNVDAPRFQFKAEAGEGGAGEELRSVRKYDRQKGGVVSGWIDPADNKLYIVNGHNRLAMATRTNEPTLKTQLLNASTAEEARLQGALINISEGRGSAIDAAKVFRDSGFSESQLQDEGISLKGEKAAQGLALANLNPFIFDRVVAGEIPVERAAIIGRGIADHGDQVALLKALDKREKAGKRLSNSQLEEMIHLTNNGPKTTTPEAQGGLFGEEHFARSLIAEKAEISEYVRQQLIKDRKLFAAVGSSGAADKLGQVGNVIKADKNAAIAEQAKQAMELYDRLSTSAGNVDNALANAAKELADGKSAAVVKARAYENIRGHLIAEADQLAGRASPGAVEVPSAERAYQVSAGERSAVQISPEQPEAILENSALLRKISDVNLPRSQREAGSDAIRLAQEIERAKERKAPQVQIDSQREILRDHLNANFPEIVARDRAANPEKYAALEAERAAIEQRKSDAAAKKAAQLESSKRPDPEFDKARKEALKAEEADAQQYRDKLEADRLSAQLNAPITRGEQKLKPDKTERQGDIFGGMPEEPAQGSLLAGAEEIAANSPLAARKQIVKDRIAEKLSGNTLSAGPGLAVELLADYAELGAIHIAEGAIRFKDWSEAMVRDLGDSVKPHLGSIWVKARQFHDDEFLAKKPAVLARSAEPGTGKASKLASGVEDKAVANKLADGFADTPEYKTVTWEDQAKQAGDLLRSDPARARRIAMGEEAPTGSLLPESVFVAVENDATANKDVNLLRDLATSSSMSMQATGMGQRISMLAMRNPDSPVAAIQQVAKAREAAAERQHGPLDKAKAKINGQIKNEISKANGKISEWQNFIESIKC